MLVIQTFFLPALIIFTLRLVDVPLYIMRFMMVARGRKAFAWFFAFCQSLVYVTALRVVFTDLGNPGKALGYAAGFATGMIFGMWLEGRLALGYTHLRVISQGSGAAIAERLRAQGFAVTEIAARGKDGAVALLNFSVRRRRTPQVIALVEELDPLAFITTEDVRPLQKGLWRR